jgi:hypothetical protein
MRVLKTHVAALALAGTLAVAAATPSYAIDEWGAAGLGFAGGLVVGSAAANAHTGYYGPGYAYAPGPGYAYAPGHATGAYAAAPDPLMVSPRPSIRSGYVLGRSATAPHFDPENGSDFDPRIGGSVKMNSSGDD